MPKTQRLSDATLVRRSQQGDRRAFGALVARYDRRLRGLAHALLLDPEQMDIALGMAYLRAWRDVVRIKPRDEIGPWLYRAAYNACVDQLRRTDTPRPTARPAPGAPGGLRAALASLAPADRVAVVLVEREGFSVVSAARILGMAPEKLEDRLTIARETLSPFVPPPAPPAPDDVEAGSTETEAAAESEETGAAEVAEVTAPAAPDDVAEPAVVHEAEVEVAPAVEAAVDAEIDDAPEPASAIDGDRAADEAVVDEAATDEAVPHEAVVDEAVADEAVADEAVEVAGSTTVDPTPDGADVEPVAAPVDGGGGNGHVEPVEPAGNGHRTDNGKSNGHTNRGRGRRARRRANGAAAAAGSPPHPTSDGGDTETEPAGASSTTGEHRVAEG